jgi:hypothetical protein
MFWYVYPELRGNVPGWVGEELLRRAEADLHRPRSGDRVTRGTLVSRFSFAIDVNEWRFRDLRETSIRQAEQQPDVRTLVESDVWDERSGEVERYSARLG